MSKLELFPSLALGPRPNFAASLLNSGTPSARSPSSTPNRTTATTTTGPMLRRTAKRICMASVPTPSSGEGGSGK